MSPDTPDDMNAQPQGAAILLVCRVFLRLTPSAPNLS